MGDFYETKWIQYRNREDKVPIAKFKEGQVVKMEAGYHTTKPYYVHVDKVYPNAKDGEIIMETSIPQKHSCEMRVGNNWGYHHGRMTIMGDRKTFGHLLINQPLD